MSNYRKELIEIEGKEYSLFIGKNAKGNDEILRLCYPHENSIWFHFEDISSPHIILQMEEKDEIYTNKKYKPYFYMIGKLLYNYKKNVPKNTKIIYSSLKYITLTKELGTVIINPKHTYYLSRDLLIPSF